jgi:hypothetical protein
MVSMQLPHRPTIAIVKIDNVVENVSVAWGCDQTLLVSCVACAPNVFHMLDHPANVQIKTETVTRRRA